VLEELAGIPWSKLKDAYGPATEVGPLLKNLATGDPTTAASASRELFGRIVHQGTVYSATPHAVPFLFEILSARSSTNLVGVVWLIACIAHGRGYWTVRGKLPGHVPATVNLEAEVREETAIQNACRVALVDGLSTLIGALSERDPLVRGGAIYALSRFSSKPSVSHALRQALEDERVGTLSAALRLSLSWTEAVSVAGFPPGSEVLESVARRARSGAVDPEEVFFLINVLGSEPDLRQVMQSAKELLKNLGC
jgi:hypothetical protein